MSDVEESRIDHTDSRPASPEEVRRAQGAYKLNKLLATLGVGGGTGLTIDAINKFPQDPRGSTIEVVLGVAAGVVTYMAAENALRYRRIAEGELNVDGSPILGKIEIPGGRFPNEPGNIREEGLLTRMFSGIAEWIGDKPKSGEESPDVNLPTQSGPDPALEAMQFKYDTLANLNNGRYDGSGGGWRLLRDTLTGEIHDPHS